MLRSVLSLLASGGTLTVEGIAFELGVARAEVEGLLRHLEALGYIEELRASVSSCADDERKSCAGCTGCGLVSSCGQGSVGKIWSLTEKGLHATGT